VFLDPDSGFQKQRRGSGRDVKEDSVGGFARAFGCRSEFEEWRFSEIWGVCEGKKTSTFAEIPREV